MFPCWPRRCQLVGNAQVCLHLFIDFRIRPERCPRQNLSRRTPENECASVLASDYYRQRRRIHPFSCCRLPRSFSLVAPHTSAPEARNGHTGSSHVASSTCRYYGTVITLEEGGAHKSGSQVLRSKELAPTRSELGSMVEDVAPKHGSARVAAPGHSCCSYTVTRPFPRQPLGTCFPAKENLQPDL